MYRADTIVACATPPGRGAISIVRLSGPDAGAIADALFEPAVARPPRPARLDRGTLRSHPHGDAIDEVLLVRMPAPHSYTGEDVVEIHCHGSPLIVERAIAAALGCGARHAGRGEFTRRAVLNGRIDLAQAEAVADLIDSRVEGGARLAWAQLQGALSESLADMRSKIVEVLAEVEAHIDFSDEELPEESAPLRVERLDEVATVIDAMLAGFPAARRLREGCRVVFVGRPNVGKSSLVNALLGHGRMIVSEEPGTTRDIVEETIDLGGLAFVLVDTAGLRDTASAAERAAVERAHQSAADAEIAVLVIDGSVPLRVGDRDLLAAPAEAERLVVINKRDRPDGLSEADRRVLASARSSPGRPPIELSARTGEGCAELIVALQAAAGGAAAGDAQPAAISRVRHRTALLRARGALEAARRLTAGDEAGELVALELRSVLTELASITDPVDNEDVLDRIFSSFCIGK